MVSFSCEGCGDVLTKKKLDSHRNQCHGASFTCLDCMVHFWGTDYRSHTSCISEAQKYQGHLYRPEKEKKNNKNSSNGNHQNNYHNNSQAVVPHKAYVEDFDDEHGANSQLSIIEPPMPEAPSPPSAAPGFRMMSEDAPNVFDFLVDSETPNASRIELPTPEPMAMIEDVPEEPKSRELTRVRFEETNESLSNLIEYGSGPVSAGAYETPAPKADRERRKERKERDLDRSEKKDKKRKRLHVDTQDLNPRVDQIMTDAPPVLHSGLTGGLGRLLSRPSVFPPSPDYSGDAGEPSPGSPLKKTKHSKRGRSISNNLMSLIKDPLGSSREHSREQSREHSGERPRRKHRKHREESERPSRRMIEYVPQNSDGAVQPETNGQNQMVVYQPRAEMLLNYITKGPESERGVSMNKALKRYHRERNAQGMSLTRAEEEKELWKSLRMKKNEFGEIVLFL